MSRPRGPQTTTIKIPTDLRKKVAIHAQERGCFQHRILADALAMYFAKVAQDTQQQAANHSR